VLLHLVDLVRHETMRFAVDGMGGFGAGCVDETEDFALLRIVPVLEVANTVLLLFHPVLRALPPLIHVQPATRSAAAWLRASARYTVAEKGGPSASSARLPELLLVDCLRQYIHQLPAARTGWLAALRDPLVGRSLSLLHEAPARPWTVDALARRVGASRTVLGERFAAVLGAPPMRYLTQWRLKLASHLLRSTRETMPEIAGRVGYESEAAFSRAFKRTLGHPPAAWRAAAGRSHGRSV
jgi:AraC family transcriptional regulator, alkane utilization regulator